jgi:hypothetical protein
MRGDDADGNVLAGLAFGALLSAPIWLAAWWLVRWCLG